MARVTAVYKPTDHPDAENPATRNDLDALFQSLFPGRENPQIDEAHDGVAIAALNPQLALKLSQLSRFIALDLPWCRRQDLRELAMQTVNDHFRCHYAFRTRIAAAESAGISAAQQAALATWQTSSLFDDEQRLVIAYTYAVLTGDVADTLFTRAAQQFGEQGVVEFTAVISFWAFWAMFLNATRPDEG